MAGIETAFHEHGIARHGETERPEDNGGKQVTSGCRVGGLPLQRGVIFGFDGFEQVFHAHDVDQRGVLEERDEAVHDTGDHMLERLRKDDEVHPLPIAQAQRCSGLILATRNGLQASAHHFGQIRRGEQGDAHQGPQQFVHGHALRHEQRQHDRGHEQNGNQRHRTDQLDKGNADGLDYRQGGLPPERQHDAQRERQGNANHRDNQGNQQSAPLFGWHFRQAEYAAGQQEIRHHWIDKQEQQGIDALERQFGDQQGYEQQGTQSKDDVGAPELGDVVEAVDEEFHLVIDVGPARPGRNGTAFLDSAHRTNGVAEDKVEEWRHYPEQKQHAERGQQPVHWRGEQVLFGPDNGPAGGVGGRFGGDQFRTNISSIGHGWSP